MQNSNMPPLNPPTGGGGPDPMGQMPQTPMSMKKKNPWFWMIIALVFVIGLAVWWYLGQNIPEPTVQQPQVNQEAREDIIIDRDINNADLGDINVEFKSIDSDLNSL